MKVYRKLSLYILAGILIFSLPGGGNNLSGSDAGSHGPGGSGPAFEHKLKGPLKTAVRVYRNELKVTNENYFYYRNEKTRNLLEKSGSKTLAKSLDKAIFLPKNRVGGAFNLNSGRVSPASENLPSRPDIVGVMINQEIQERWGNPSYDVIECNIEIRGNVSMLNNFNLKVRALSEFEGKTIVSAEVAAPEIEKVAKLKQVLRISPVLKKTSNNDLGSDAIRATRIRIKTGNNFDKGYTGEGVIVGVIDSGIDWTHEDFVDPDTGGTRIRYIWDTEVYTPGRTPADVFGGALSGLTYGTVWTQAEIDGGTCTSVDTHGHGTHVSGTAAGNGYATGNYAGIAPNADILFVKGLDNNGILFIYEVSDQLGMPCSINMSYGPAYPIHYITMWPEDFPADGSSSDAQEIAGWNATYGGGHIPVKSAGNDGHWSTYTDLSGGSYPYMNGAFHSEGRRGATQVAHTYMVPNYSTIFPYYYGYYPWLLISFWSDVPAQVTLISPQGYQYGPISTSVGWFIPDGYLFTTITATPEINGHYTGVVELVNPPGQPTEGDWQVIVEAVGGGELDYDLWCSELLSGAFIYEINSYFTGNYSHSNYIIDEGASPYEISVGAFVTRDGWLGSDGNGWTYTMQPKIGQVAPFSSPGPSRDRRVKPDISAPGEIIMSAASQFAASNPSDLDPDLRHIQNSGTSMAAPMVTGASALILQKYPSSGLNQVKRMLANWALQDNKTRNLGENAFGHGKLNVRPLNDPGVAVLTQNKTKVVLDNADLTVEFDGSGSYDPEDFPIRYDWAIEEQPDGANGELTVNNDKAVLKVDPEIEGDYVVSLLIFDQVVEGPKAYSQTIEARFYPVLPPTGVSLERVVNDLIFTREYVNRIIWTENPANMLELSVHRVYRKVKGNGDDTYVLVAELDPTSSGYDDRGLTKDQLYTYKITSVSTNGKESDPVVVSN